MDEEAKDEEPLGPWKPTNLTNYIPLYYEVVNGKAARFKEHFGRSPTPSQAELEEEDWAGMEEEEVDSEEEEEEEDEDCPPRRRRRMKQSSASEVEEEEEKATQAAAEEASEAGGAMELFTRVPELAKEGVRVVVDGWHGVVVMVVSTHVAVMYDEKIPKWEAMAYSQCRLLLALALALAL